MSNRAYYRVMLGRKSMYAKDCLAGGFIGADFGIQLDLNNELTDDLKLFNQKFIPIYLKNRPEKTKGSAGLSCGALWTISKGINVNDIVLCPNGEGAYLVGEVSHAYQYYPGEILPHRRRVKWLQQTIQRSQMSQALQNSTGSIGTVCDISKYSDELKRLLGDATKPSIISTDPIIEDPHTFALEAHLEDFLVQNWMQTDLGSKYNIYEEDGETAGQQYPTDTGNIDILALSKDKKEFLVVELKKGRASDTVVGQIQRYMGYIKHELASENQVVRGLIIASEDHLSIRRALSVTTNIEFCKYEVSFTLKKSCP